MSNPFFSKPPSTKGDAASIEVGSRDLYGSQEMGDTALDQPQSVPGVPIPGEVLAGKYRVERVLGVGGMGAVVAAIHLDLEELVAVKFLLPQAPGAQPDAVARFVREAKAAIKIRSEHVVRVLDSGKLEDGTPYMVMEFLDGRDLNAVLEDQGPLATEQAVDYLLQACDAVASAHSLGIIHRDLKPGNLFLTRRGDGTPLVKVLDFGISKIISDNPASSGLTSTTAIMGTPAFMSPEQLRSTRHVDARADIWSLGTILYAFLTGEPPYAGESTADLAAKIIRDPPPPIRSVRPQVPEALEAVVLRCLEKEPDARFPGVAELAEALLPFASEASRASAARLAKQISSRQLGHAPTMLSGPPADPPSKSLPSPTRTANAWGESGRLDQTAAAKKGIGFYVSIAAASAAIAGAVMAFVVPRSEPASPAVSAPPHAAASPTSVPSLANPVRVLIPNPTADTTATPTPTATSTSTPTPTPTPTPTANATSAAVPLSPGLPAKPHGPRGAPPAKTKPAAGAPSASVAPLPPPAPTQTSGGLFDDRE
jgi:serine/threonine-protein kinase